MNNNTHAHARQVKERGRTWGQGEAVDIMAPERHHVVEALVESLGAGQKSHSLLQERQLCILFSRCSGLSMPAVHAEQLLVARVQNINYSYIYRKL
jgi:hypothetical protein